MPGVCHGEVTKGSADLGGEAHLIDHVISPAIRICVDVDGIEDIVVKIKIVRA
jgi:hypothetical protein